MSFNLENCEYMCKLTDNMHNQDDAGSICSRNHHMRGKKLSWSFHDLPQTWAMINVSTHSQALGCIRTTCHADAMDIGCNWTVAGCSSHNYLSCSWSGRNLLKSQPSGLSHFEPLTYEPSLERCGPPKWHSKQKTQNTVQDYTGFTFAFWPSNIRRKKGMPFEGSITEQGAWFGMMGMWQESSLSCWTTRQYLPNT